LPGGAIINNIKVRIQTHQRWPLAHNIVGQRVQGANAIAHSGQQPRFAHKAVNAAAKIINGGIDQRDNQYFLLIVDLGDQL